jgi:16S rRNA (uracil1498-N3)-methyltransferase
MLPRFLVPDLDAQRPDVALPPEEGHHLSRVLRLKVGNEVAVFDGHGREFRARVASVERDRVTVRLLDSVPQPSQPKVALTLVQSILKGEPMDDVIRDCTMAGVESIQPVVSARTTVKASLLARSVERWRRVAIAATKQCGRSRLPDIRDVMRLDEWVRSEGSEHALMLLEPAATVSGTITVRDLARQPVPAHAQLLVGPEGGWAVEERDLAIAAGCVPLSLGRLTLRADAVPLAATAALLAIWDDDPVGC